MGPAGSFSEARTAELQSALIEAAVSAPSHHAFRAESMKQLARHIGFDTAAVVAISLSRPTTLNKQPAMSEAFAAKARRYVEDLEPLRLAALSSRGVVIDTKVLSAGTRDRLSMYRDIVRPQRLHSVMFCYLAVRGSPIAVLSLGRGASARSFTDREADGMRALVPILALGEAVHSDRNPTAFADDVDVDDLTARERTIIEGAARGLRNREIALVCGTSPNTVRNQLAAIYRKLGIGSRAELVRIALERRLVT